MHRLDVTLPVDYLVICDDDEREERDGDVVSESEQPKRQRSVRIPTATDG